MTLIFLQTFYHMQEHCYIKTNQQESQNLITIRSNLGYGTIIKILILLILQFRYVSLFTTHHVMPSLSTITFLINIPPQNCVLSLSPNQGVALQTVFSIQFLNCDDEDAPLTYQFYYYNSQSVYEQELVVPWNITRRQIKDQTMNSVMNTTLPQGNLIIMSQVMDSQLGVTNNTLPIQAYGQNQTEYDYQTQVNQLIEKALQNSQSYNDQVVSLSMIGEDLSKSSQFQSSQQINDIKAQIITNLQQKSLLLPQFSLLSTYTNKVIAQLQQTLTKTQQNQKDSIYDQLNTIIKNTQSSISSNNTSSLQQNNDIHVQNLIDSFKILNSTVNQVGSLQEIQQHIFL